MLYQLVAAEKVNGLWRCYVVCDGVRTFPYENARCKFGTAKRYICAVIRPGDRYQECWPRTTDVSITYEDLMNEIRKEAEFDAGYEKEE